MELIQRSPLMVLANFAAHSVVEPIQPIIIGYLVLVLILEATLTQDDVGPLHGGVQLVALLQ